MERSQSVPPRGSVAVQPFWSDRLQQELQLEALRPRSLPSPIEESVLPMQDAGLENGRSGKGRGGMTEGSMERFVRPVGEPRVFGPMGQSMGIQSQGVMPEETVETRRSMGPRDGHVKNVEGEKVDALQRGLEVEMVDFLRQQNSQLMEEVANLKSKL